MTSRSTDSTWTNSRLFWPTKPIGLPALKISEKFMVTNTHYSSLNVLYSPDNHSGKCSSSLFVTSLVRASSPVRRWTNLLLSIDTVSKATWQFHTTYDNGARYIFGTNSSAIHRYSPEHRSGVHLFLCICLEANFHTRSGPRWIPTVNSLSIVASYPRWKHILIKL